MSEQASFPSSFWTANTTELFERAAYYSMASFVVLYLAQLGLGDYWPSTLNGFLWGLVYFLPILSGTVADQIGFRKALIAACLLLGLGYFCMGYPVWFGGQVLAEHPGDAFTAHARTVFPLCLGLLLIGVGGSIVKPCISGTVQKTAGARATLAFGIFYTVINVGSLLGRLTAWKVRSHHGLSSIFLVAMGAALLALLVTLAVFREPAEIKRSGKSVLRILADMVLVLRNGRFAVFLIITSGFFFLYSQVYNVLPLYLKKVVESKPPMDLYTLANPLVIVLFQLLITRRFGRLAPIRSMVVGTAIIGGSMLLNLVPLVWGGCRLQLWDLLPLGSAFVVLSVAFIAFGELFTLARIYEYLGSLAPKGQEGLFLGYANLPTALGSLIGGPAGAWIFKAIMCRHATLNAKGLLDLDPRWNAAGWTILMAIGLLSALSMALYHRWLQRH